MEERLIIARAPKPPRTNPDTVHLFAKRAAARGEALESACLWPFDSWEGKLFKEVFIMHKAALAALGMNDKTLTPD
jgi:hypothetical protein